MGKINVLSADISNKIAAGEVVERPASVVKELVENSIDAGANVISVEIKSGGVAMIKVTDNGSGIAPDDLPKAFLRHATSKISSAEDLEAIYTLGFRGEALSSVCAVSHMSIHTKRKEDNLGCCVHCDGGEISDVESAGCPDGTCVEVRNLFFNTPARMKFLKTDKTEASYISDFISRQILAHPEVSFKLISNGKQIYFSPGDGVLRNAVYTVYGKDYANAMIDVNYTSGKIKVTGMVGKGGIARPNRNFQSYFVNNRYIKSGLVIKAVEEGFKNQIMIGKFPVAVLNIEINPSLIDINVHPTKLEVKFSDEKAVYEAVYYAVKNALYTPVAAEREIVMPEKKTPFTPTVGKQEDLTKLIKKQDYKTRYNPFEEQLKTVVAQANPEVRKIPPVKPDKKTETKPIIKEAVPEKKDVLAQFRKAEKTNVNALREPGYDEIPKKPEADEQPKAEVKPPVQEKEERYARFSGQIFDTYIIAEEDDKMLIIDQHAAHERLKFEELKNSEHGIFSQMLLEPVILTVSGEELAALEENHEILLNLGFDADRFGDRQIIIRSAPSDLDYEECGDLLTEILTQITSNKKNIITDAQERFIYTVACKAAIKANHRLSEKEAQSLIDAVLKLDNINTCPHGRPIIMTMTKYELEKQFKRIQ